MSSLGRGQRITLLVAVVATVAAGALHYADALWQITGDGEATVFAGIALIAMYVTLAAYAWLD